MTALGFTLNGERVETEAEPRTHLADLLRERLGLTGTHLGCEQGACGACTVLLDGVPVRSCLVFAPMCEGAEVRTIEGFDDDPLMARLRDAFSRHHGLQCGFCTPGMLITARDVVSRLPGAGEARIRNELSGNLCRCTGYVGIVRAVREIAAEAAAALPAAPPPAVPARPLPPPGKFAVADPETTPPLPAALPAADTLEPGWSRLRESFSVARHPDEVWQLFADLPRMVACIPGAALDAADGKTLAGRMHLSLGPISATFAGNATLERDDAGKRGVLSGAGGDERQNSRAKGRVTYQLAPEAGGTTRVDLTLDYALHGPLAQFGRSGLVKDFAGRLVREFVQNLSLALSGAGAPAPASSLNAGAMLWAMLRAWIRSLFGRRHG